MLKLKKTTAEKALVLPFTKDSSDKTGASERGIYRDIQISKNLAPEVKGGLREYNVIQTTAEEFTSLRMFIFQLF